MPPTLRPSEKIPPTPYPPVFEVKKVGVMCWGVLGRFVGLETKTKLYDKTLCKVAEGPLKVNPSPYTKKRLRRAVAQLRGFNGLVKTVERLH